ncbi:hypothetical protein [Idiomarina loihiensis]|uniref:hypothetical protein n=1 Tax=Idiomarina loihiensis TaxID=135577 RepID=UPI00384BA619
MNRFGLNYFSDSREKYSISNVEIFFAFFISIVVTTISLLLTPYLVDGDQLHYRELYRGLDGKSIVEGFVFYQSRINSVEPIYYLIAWVSSNVGLEKDVLISVSNGFLSFLMTIYFRRIGAHYLPILMLTFLNFYTYVIFFSAERLKYSFIFILLALLFIGKIKGKFAIGISVLTHLQSAVFWLSIGFSMASKKFLGLAATRKVKRKTLVWMLPTLLVLIAILFVMMPQIIRKLGYFNQGGLIDSVKILVFLILAILASRKIKEPIGLIFPIVVLSFSIGGSRLGIVAYCFFLYLSFPRTKGLDFFNFSLFVYFGFGVVELIINTIQHGTVFK